MGGLNPVCARVPRITQRLHRRRRDPKEVYTSDMYACGAALYDSGYPFKDVFITRPTLTCADSIEAYFYTLGVRGRYGLTENLCCFRAEGQADELDKELCDLLTTVFPVCRACLTAGYKIPVRQAIRNSAYRSSRATIIAQRKARREVQSLPLRAQEAQQHQAVQDEVRIQHPHESHQPHQEIRTTTTAIPERERGNGRMSGRGRQRH